MTRQHAVVAALLDHAVIAPRGNTGPRAFDPDRVEPVWRVSGQIRCLPETG